MGMKIKKITVSNFRQHEFLEFVPAQNGITAISGPSGAGKSTILDAMAWALYGIKPKGVSKQSSLVRRGTDFSDGNRCYVEVDFRVDGANLRVHRELRNGRTTECEVYEYQENSQDYVLEAGPATSHAESYIRKRLKKDANGFMSAVYVRQKSIDDLIEPGNSKTSKVVEKLLGISSISESLVSASEELKDLKRTIKVSATDGTDVEELEKSVKKMEADLSKITQKKDSVHERIEKEKENYEQREARYGDYRHRQESAEKLDYKISNLTPHVERLAQEKEELLDLRSRLDEELSSVGNYGNYEKIKEENLDLKSQLSNLDKRLTRAEDWFDNSKKTLEEYSEELSLFAFSSVSEAKKESKRLEDLFQSLIKKNDSVQEKTSTNRVIAQQKEETLNVLKTGKCPTCKQEIHDQEVQVNEYLRELERLSQERESLFKELYDIQEELKELVSYSDVDRWIEIFEKDLDLKSKISDNKNKYSDLKRKRNSLNSQVDISDDLLRSAQSVKEIKDRFRSTSKRLESLIDESAQKSKELKELTAQRSSVSPVEDSTLSSAKSQLESARDKVKKLEDSYNQLSLDEKGLSVELRESKKSLSRAKDQLSKYQLLLKNLEKTTATVNVLSEFRQDRIDNSIPTIESFASDLLNGFTDGKFVGVELDSKFKPTVIRDDGTKFSAGELSGGEFSVTSLSLVLAISLMLNVGSSENLIIMDEVLNSQDSGRAENVLHSIKNTVNGQVILISHSEALSDVVDKTLEL